MLLLWASFLLGILITGTDYEFWTTPDVPELQDMPAMRWFFWIWFPVVYALFAALIYFISRRKNWARWILAILELAGLALLAWLWFEGYDSGWSWTDAAVMAMDYVALYWLFTGEGAKWFGKP